MATAAQGCLQLWIHKRIAEFLDVGAVSSNGLEVHNSWVLRYLGLNRNTLADKLSIDDGTYCAR